MLKTQLNFIDIDETGRIITVQDTTGVYNIDNLNGYNIPNLLSSDIQNIIFTISHYNSSKINKAIFSRIGDPNNLSIFYNPTIDDITSGKPLELTSLHFGITVPDEGINAFKDGIWDLNMYTVFNEVTGVAGEEGNPYIIGTELDTYFYSNMESIYINGEFYRINRTMPTNEGTVLYLLDDLKEDITSFYPVYRANTKVYNATQSNCILQNYSGKLALEGCKISEDEKTVFRLTMYKIMAQLDFNAEDYANANEKLVGAYKASQSLNCNC